VTDEPTRRDVFKILGFVTAAAMIPAPVRLALRRVSEEGSREVILLDATGSVLGRAELDAGGVAFWPAGVGTGVIAKVAMPRMVKHFPPKPRPELREDTEHLSMVRNRAGGWTVTAEPRVADVTPIHKAPGDSLRFVHSWISEGV
jgi:hypothetical protein